MQTSKICLFSHIFPRSLSICNEQSDMCLSFLTDTLFSNNSVDENAFSYGRLHFNCLFMVLGMPIYRTHSKYEGLDVINKAILAKISIFENLLA